MDGDVAAMRAAEGERIAREKKVAPEVEMRGKDEEAGEGEAGGKASEEAAISGHRVESSCFMLLRGVCGMRMA